MQKIKNGLKTIIFLAIGVWMYFGVESVFVQKASAERFEQFAELDKNSLDIVLIGTSHMEAGYLPMETFMQYGVTSYILSTAQQPIEMSYLMAEYMFKTQKPKVVILDASNLFFDDFGNWAWALDRIPASKEKYEMAKVYCKKKSNHLVIEEMLPMIKYHTRWDSLTSQDFFVEKPSYYSMGGLVSGYRGQDSGYNLESMNAATYKENIVYHTSGIYDKKYMEQELTEDHEYHAEIPEECQEYLLRIKDLCESNGAELLMTKIPTINDPEVYPSAWTKIRSEITEDVCSQYDIPFYDILYHGDSYLIDASQDFMDDGRHMNLRGALKTTKSINDYLMSHYHFEPHEDELFSTEIDEYEQEKNKCLLKTENDLATYVQRLKEYKESGKTILIASTLRTLRKIPEECREPLRGLGLQADYSKYDMGGYTAWIDSNEVRSEEVSSYVSTVEIETEEESAEEIEKKKVEYSLSAKEEEIYQVIEYTITKESSETRSFWYPSVIILVYDRGEMKMLDTAFFQLDADSQAISRMR